MASSTPNISLVKPNRTELAEVDVLNDNWDRVDDAFKADRDRLDAVEGSVDSMGDTVSSLGESIDAIENAGYQTEEQVEAKVTATINGAKDEMLQAMTVSLQEYVSNLIQENGVVVDLEGYAKLNGADFTGQITVLAPVEDMNPATKKYVDDNYVSNDALEQSLGSYATVSSLGSYATVSSLDSYASKEYVDEIIGEIVNGSY